MYKLILNLHGLRNYKHRNELKYPLPRLIAAVTSTAIN